MKFLILNLQTNEEIWIINETFFNLIAGYPLRASAGQALKDFLCVRYRPTGLRYRRKDKEELTHA